MTTFIIVLIITLLLVPVMARNKEKRYWSQKQIDKRNRQEDLKRKEEVEEWYKSTIKKIKSES